MLLISDLNSVLSSASRPLRERVQRAIQLPIPASSSTSTLTSGFRPCFVCRRRTNDTFGQDGSNPSASAGPGPERAGLPETSSGGTSTVPSASTFRTNAPVLPHLRLAPQHAGLPEVSQSKGGPGGGIRGILGRDHWPRQDIWGQGISTSGPLVACIFGLVHLWSSESVS